MAMKCNMSACGRSSLSREKPVRRMKFPDWQSRQTLLQPRKPVSSRCSFSQTNTSPCNRSHRVEDFAISHVFSVTISKRRRESGSGGQGVAQISERG